MVAIHAQVHIAPAAKAAGAHVFIPREFWWPTEYLNDKQLGLKGALHAKLREVGPPLLLVYTGAFSDSLWNEYGVSLSLSLLCRSG